MWAASSAAPTMGTGRSATSALCQLALRVIGFATSLLVNSQAQDQPEALIDLALEFRVSSSGRFRKIVPIQRDDLGDIGHGILGKPGMSCGHQHIPRRLQKSEVGSENDGQNGLDPAAVEGVSLNNQDGPAKPGFRPARFRQLGPPDGAPFNYHASAPSDRVWARRTGASSPLGSAT